MADAPYPPVILAVDDAPDMRLVVERLLRDHYRVRLADSGPEALRQVALVPPPALVLLDIEMPGMNGFEVCRRLKNDPATRDIPVIFLTGHQDPEREQHGFAVGAVDFITKPISPSILLARIDNHLRLHAAALLLRGQNAYLEAEVRRRMLQVTQVQDATVLALATLAEARDPDIGQHVQRTQLYVRLLARQLARIPGFSGVLDDTTVDDLYKAAALHDIGKVGIPDRILRKPGQLDAEEYAIMQTHTTLGRDALLAAERMVDTPSRFLRMAREIAHWHQEKWDGSGYPDGLAGDQIPLGARVMAVADVYDALMSRRRYKPRWVREAAREEIVRGRGRHFDPAVVEAFLRAEPEMAAVAEQFRDSDPAPTPGTTVQLPPLRKVSSE
jgi:putative two-component system response regulator